MVHINQKNLKERKKEKDAVERLNRQPHAKKMNQTTVLHPSQKRTQSGLKT